MKYLVVPFALVIWLSLALSGCGGSLTAATLNTDIPFSERQGRIPARVGLYISEASRSYVVRQSVRKDAGMSKQTVDFTADVGAALEPNAVRSLGMIFDEVVVVRDLAQTDVPRVVTIDVNPDSYIRMGPMTFSKHTVRIVLDCGVVGQGARLWTGRFDSEAADASAAGLLAGGVFAVYARQKSLGAMQQAAEESLYLDLEALNEQLLRNRQLFETSK